MQEEKITIQSLTDNKEIHIGYSDKDIVIIDSVQKFAEITSAHVAMSAIVICTNGKVQAMMNGKKIELCQNQVAAIPSNTTITDLMVSPNFDLKGIFLTNNIIQSFLHEKMYVWNEFMYIHDLNVISLEEEDIQTYTLFYELLKDCSMRPVEMPFRTEVIQALLRAAVLALCGMLQKITSTVTNPDNATRSSNTHFQRFLDLLHSERCKYRTVECYANELCISSKHLSVICKKHSGKTANQWITEVVLKDISHYLKHSDLSIKQICDQLGFPNPSFFGKYVKTHLGMTPMQYRASQSL